MAMISRTIKVLEIKNPDGSTFYTTPECISALKSVNPDIETKSIVGTFSCTVEEFLSLAKLKT